MAGEPQTDVQITVVPLEGVVTQNVVDDRIVFSVPDGVNFQIEVLSVGFVVVTAPVGGDILADIEWVDDSESDAKANLKASVNLEALAANVYNEGYRGSRVLDPGDSINIEITTSDATVTTADVGLAAVVESRILRRS